VQECSDTEELFSCQDDDPDPEPDEESASISMGHSSTEELLRAEAAEKQIDVNNWLQDSSSAQAGSHDEPEPEPGKDQNNALLYPPTPGLVSASPGSDESDTESESGGEAGGKSKSPNRICPSFTTSPRADFLRRVFRYRMNSICSSTDSVPEEEEPEENSREEADFVEDVDEDEVNCI